MGQGVIKAGSTPFECYVGSFTRDLSLVGAQAISGVGFQPSKVLFMYAGAETTETFGLGLDDGAFDKACRDYHHITADSFACSGGMSIYVNTDAGKSAYAQITAFGADGFTVTWDKGGLPTGTLTVLFLALP